MDHMSSSSHDSSSVVKASALLAAGVVSRLPHGNAQCLIAISIRRLQAQLVMLAASSISCQCTPAQAAVPHNVVSALLLLLLLMLSLLLLLLLLLVACCCCPAPVLQWLLMLSNAPDSQPEHFKEAFVTLLTNAGGVSWGSRG